MPKRIRDLTALTPATGDHVVVDRPTGPTGRANISANVTPNTLALRTAQGSVLSGAKDGPNTVLRVEGFYWWYDPNKWLRLARWTGVSGALKGIFADLIIHRTVNQSFGARLRVEAATDGSGALGQPAISLALDRSPIVTNAALVQTSADTIELWALFPWGNVYVSGVVGTNVGDVQLAPPGDVNSLVQDTPPTPVSGGIYLEWATATVSETLLGPGYIVAASRTPTSGYIRYDNGVQVCWATITAGSGTWTYPAAFASTPQVQATAQDTAPRIATITSVSTTAAGVLRTNLSGTTQSGTVYLWAIGLWK
jgi:hypothetical protein